MAHHIVQKVGMHQGMILTPRRDITTKRAFKMHDEYYRQDFTLKLFPTYLTVVKMFPSMTTTVGGGCSEKVGFVKTG